MSWLLCVLMWYSCYNSEKTKTMLFEGAQKASDAICDKSPSEDVDYTTLHPLPGQLR